MRAIERLKRDHHILRSKLDVLEGALKMGPSAWFVLREVCFTLARQLRDHMRREEELVMACRRAMTPNVLAEIAVAHKDEPEHWKALTRMFLEEKEQRLDRIGPVLRQTIDGLRRHMTEEERGLFPIFERMLADQPAALAVPGALDETMTVNRVLHEFPATAPVFHRLWVNAPLEGYSCLDEVAWRHGMSAEELLHILQEAIGACACRCPQKEPQEEPQAAAAAEKTGAAK